MLRRTTFEIDLALLGGQDEASARQLRWGTFVQHWRAELPRRRVFEWNLQKDRGRWVAASLAPPEWSTALWPDFKAAFRTSKGELEYKEVTLLHMALRDAVDGNPEAAVAFDWLIQAGVSPNVWPGHGTSAVAEACLRGHVRGIQAIAQVGGDLRCKVTAKARPEFLGSTLLFRVGSSVARLASQAGPSSTNKYAKVLELLVHVLDDPTEPNDAGVSPLAGIRAENPVLAAALQAQIARRREQAMWAAWGGASDPARHQGAWDAQAEWAVRAPGETAPAFLVPESPDPFNPGPDWPRPFRVVQEPTPGAVVARALAPQAWDGKALDAAEALRRGAACNADALIEATPDGPRWWLFHPRQVRPALFPLDAAPPPPRPRL